MSVSVVIPAFNAERYLGQALESVFAQTCAPLEVIVVDDGSTDATLEVAAQFAVRVLPQAHAGITASRNAGLQAAHGTWLTFLDADDLWLPTKLERQLEVLNRAPEVELVSCRVEQFGDGTGFERFPAGDHIGCWLVARGSFDRLGLFPAFDTGDWMMWLTRARARGLREARVDEVLYRRRLHAFNYGRDERRKAEYARMLHAHLRSRPTS